jgi:DNA-binding CsgD family transcriptional regulator
MDTAVSAFLLRLYRAARSLPHAQLRPWVFEQLQSCIGFDSGFWYRCALVGEAADMHAWYLDRQPEDLMTEYVSRELWRDDTVFHRLMTSPRETAVRVSSEEDFKSERMRDFLRRNRQRHLMSICMVDEVPQVAAGMSLYRNDSHCSFTAADGRMFELVTPHVIDSWRENWLRELTRSASSASMFNSFSMAVQTARGMLSDAQDSFAAHMALEWPDWRGPWLPEPMLVQIASQSDAPWCGRTITAYSRRQADGNTLLHVRPRHAFDSLSPRKREVALLFASGAAQASVAARTSLSASTVNNYLVEIYRKLGVSDKSGLALLVAGLQP